MQTLSFPVHRAQARPARRVPAGAEVVALPAPQPTDPQGPTPAAPASVVRRAA
jgi:hypothetical protein